MAQVPSPGAQTLAASSLAGTMLMEVLAGSVKAQTTLDALAQFITTDIPVTTGITAHAGGGQTLATALGAGMNNVTTVATIADSVKLPASTAGDYVIVINSAANAMQVFGSGTDTINGVATATGISQAGKMIYVYYCAVAGNWLTQSSWVVTSASADALAVGLNGITNPALQVDASTASSATGVKVKSAAAAGGVAVSAISSGTDENLTLDAKGSGTVTINGTATGAISLARNTSVTGTATVTAANANALAVGANGATNPVLEIDTATASAATGIKITGAAAAGGVAVATISSGTDENVTIDAKGTGTLTLQGTATGNIVAGRTLSGLSATMTGNYDSRSATATPAAASAVAAYTMGSATIGIYWGTGDPNAALTAAQGSLYIRTDGSSTSTRLYINTNGTNGWTSITTAT